MKWDFKNKTQDIKESRSLSSYKELSDFVTNLNRMTIHNNKSCIWYALPMATP